MATRSHDEVLQVVRRNIRIRRQMLGLSQTGLAWRMGLSTESSLSSIELGLHSPSLRTLARIAEALDTDLVTLLVPMNSSADSGASQAGDSANCGVRG